jgi:hypothetical protein
VNLQQFHDLMRPARAHVYRQRCIETAVRTVNQAAAAVAVVLAGAVVLNLAVGLAFKIEVPGSWIGIGSALIVIGIMVKNGRICLTGIPWRQAAAALDAVGSRHNQIAAAYELICDGKETPFARIAVVDGFRALRHADVAKLSRANSKLNGRSVAAVVLAAMLCIGSSFTSQTGAGYAGVENNPTPLASAGKLPEIPLSPASASLARPSGSQNGIGKNPARAYDMAENASAPAMSRAAAAGMSLSENASSGISKPKTAVQPSSDTLTFAGFLRAGSSAAPPGQTDIQTDRLHAQHQLNEDQLDDVIHEKESGKNSAGSSNRPFLDDRSAAPGRELGRSGKTGKPGDGRGGPGSVKKSRSTAAIFPGEKVPVHLQSMPNPGKSKSFPSNMPLEPLTDAEPFPLAARPEQEAQICPYRVPDHLKTITQYYFEEVYSYANRVDRDRPQTD